ncbi:MAG: hypothetical protein R3Y35_04110 [Clostridia bacterium]
MRKIVLFIAVVLVFLNTGITVNANTAEDLGVDTLFDYVDDSGQDILEYLGIKNSVDSYDVDLENVIDLLSDLFKEKYVSPFKCLSIAISAIVLSSFLSSFDGDSEKFCSLAGALAVCAIYLPYIALQITAASNLIDSVSVFTIAAIPIYTVLHIACGNVALGTSYGGISIIGANLYIRLLTDIVIPSLSIFLGLSVSACFSHINIKSIADSIYKFIKWIMVLSVTIFSGIVSVQSAVAGATDVASAKTIKFIAGTTIPVVGTAFGDGITAIQYSISVLKTGAGAFGIIACVCIFLPYVVELLLWMFSCQIALLVSEIFSAKSISDFLSLVMVVLKIIMALMLSICIISIVTSAITLVYGA